MSQLQQFPPSKLLVSGVTATRSTTASSRNTRLVASRDDGHAHWCSICHNGGKLMLCSTCDRGVCLDSCLPTNIPANARKAVFTCPDCWRRNKETRGEPYKGISTMKTPLFLRGKASSRSMLPMLHPVPLAVVSIRLEGLDHEGDPSFLVYNAIKPFYPQGTRPAVFINLVYNIPDDDDGAGLGRYSLDLDEAITKLSNYRRFVVFLTTHSTPNSGLLWNVPGGKGAVAVEQLFNAILPPRLLSTIGTDASASLFLITCGGIHAEPDSRRQISEFARKHFAAIWGFASFDLHPNLTGLFLQSLILAFYVKLRPALLENLLRESVELGTHSSIIVYLRKGGIYEYLWAHPVARPLGVVLPQNCSSCGRLESWAIPKLAIASLPTTATISCAKCSNAFSCSISALCRVTAKSRDASGEWFARCLDGPNAIKSFKWSYVGGVLTGIATECT